MKLRNIVVGMLVLGLAAPASAAYGTQMNHKAAVAGSGSSNGCAASSISTTAMGNSYTSGSDNQACWFNRIALGGSMAMDFGRVQNKASGVKTNKKILSIRNAAFSADVAVAKDWAAHFTMNMYQDNAYFNATHTGTLTATVDEAWVYYRDTTAPVYFKMGKMFVDFGNYTNPYTAMPSLNQMTTQFDANALQLGWAGDQGFDASVFGFLLDTTTSVQKHAVGANASYHGELQKGVNVSANIGVINDVRGIYSAVTSKATGGTNDSHDLGETFWVSGLTLERKSALTGALNVDFEGFNGYVNYVHAPELVAATANTKLNVWGFGVGYTTTVNVPMHFNFGYEKTNANSQAIFTAKNHISASVTADVVKNVSVGVSWNKYESFTTNTDVTALLATAEVSFLRIPSPRALCARLRRYASSSMIPFSPPCAGFFFVRKMFRN